MMIPNWSRNLFLAFHTLLETLFPTIHQKLEREVINNYSLLYKWPGKNPELAPMALLAHIDVVPVEREQKKTGPMNLLVVTSPMALSGAGEPWI